MNQTSAPPDRIAEFLSDPGSGDRRQARDTSATAPVPVWEVPTYWTQFAPISLLAADNNATPDPVQQRAFTRLDSQQNQKDVFTLTLGQLRLKLISRPQLASGGKFPIADRARRYVFGRATFPLYQPDADFSTR